MKKLATKCVQAGYSPKNGEPRVTPIVQSTTFLYENPEEMAELFNLSKAGYFYTRLGNPTLGVFEEKMTALEGGVGALATASGMSATMFAVLTIAQKGDNIVSAAAIYGGTYNLFKVTLPRLGVETRFFTETASEAEIEALIDENTKVIFAESLANPAMTVCDFAKLAKIAKKHGIVFIVDNTLPTPYLCRPFEHGANIIVHASTKYLDGHATSLGGVIVDGGNFDWMGNPRYPLLTEADESYHGLVFGEAGGKGAFILRARGVCMRDMGAQMAPMNAFLTCIGIETLHLRMPRHSENAFAVAKALEGNPNVEWVKYAGLPDDKNYALAQKYFDRGLASGMVSFGIKGGTEAAARFQKALKLFAVVTHIADSRSCVLHPATTTHRQLSESDMEVAGIPQNLIRLSVGTEDAEDIIEDILQALDRSK